MQLTKKQEEGLRVAVARYKEKQQYTCIAGYAGTGKSTLVKFIIEALQIQSSDVCYIAYTGKAALVLRDKGCPNAMTAHKLLYQSYPKADGTFYHKIKKPIEPYKIIIVDEVSMLPKEMWNLLLSHRVHVIALGDPFQLPPIGEDNGVLSEPHVFLDEIMRQAQESEIIRLTMDIRAGKSLSLFKGNEVQIIDKKDLVSGMFLWADQIICAKNETRRWVNSLVRKYKYGEDVSEEPIVGDKIICLRNSWDTITENGDVLVNGTTGIIQKISYRKGFSLMPKMMFLDILPEGYTEADLAFKNINADYKLLTTGEATVTKANFKRFPKTFRPEEFDYGYCVTCWKAQGSEYDNVLVFEEDFPHSAEERARYLYTAATRSKKKLILVRNK